MLDIQYGYELPEDGDVGSIVFPALERDIQRMATHNHDGTASARLNPGSLLGSTQLVDSTDINWGPATPQGSSSTMQSLLIDMGLASISTLIFDEVNPTFRKKNGTEYDIELNLHFERVGANSFRIFAQEKLDLIIIYK
jgi:hypothetical protein